MHKEYAVDPATLASSWTTFLYLTEKFGFEKGRLISDFPPTKWANQVKVAAGPLADVEKKKLMEKLQSRREMILAKTGRYFSVRATWLESAIFAHRSEPFHGIISDNSSQTHSSMVCSQDCQETHPLMCPLSGPVERTPEALAAAARLLLVNSRRIKFVDPYFDLRGDRWLDVLKEFLDVVYQRGYANSQCEYHYGERDQGQTPVEFANSCGSRLRGIVPSGMTVTFVRWRQKSPGERLHARYILTERGGLIFEGGLDRGGDGQTTDINLLDPAPLKMRWEAFNIASTVYELIKPIVSVDSAGHVTEVNT